MLFIHLLRLDIKKNYGGKNTSVAHYMPRYEDTCHRKCKCQLTDVRPTPQPVASAILISRNCPCRSTVSSSSDAVWMNRAARVQTSIGQWSFLIPLVHSMEQSDYARQ